MSAYLDKAQGITFVYSNIFEIYKMAKEARIDAPFVAEPVRVLKKETVKAEAYQPQELRAPATERPFAVPMGVREAEERAKRQGMRPVAQLQKNLAEIGEAHEKLRFLLQEIESLTKKK